MAAQSTAPTSEDRRLQALHEYELLDAPAGDELEAIVRIAAAVAGVPYATLNLIDENRQCQLTTVGFDGQDSTRDDSMCATHFLAGELVVSPDARADPRFAHNPWVDGRLAEVRFYASAPLVTPDGYALGSLCVFSDIPGSLDEAQAARLVDLAQVLLALFERRRQARLQAALATETEEQRALASFALHELAERQAFTAAILDTVDVGIVACGSDGRLTLFNETARDWHDLDADAALEVGEHAGHYSLFAKDGTTPLPSGDVPLHRALEDGRVDAAEMVIAPQHRPPLRVLTSGRSLLAEDGSVLGAVVAMKDVTEERHRQQALETAYQAVEQREAELRALNAELRRSNHELELFAAAAGHDLSAPLTAIAGYVELLGDVYGGHLDERARSWIDTVIRSVARMRGLIESLLAYSAVGATSCRRELVDTREVVEQVVADLRIAIKKGDADVRVIGNLPVVEADATLVRQLLQNLLSNAIKYRDPERRCAVTVSASAEPSFWRFSVTDNGPGIPEDDQERVFGVFERGDGLAAPGHGLGLATCQRIVERHEGRVWIESSSPKGTTFCFTLRR